jgi:hypothetical protein
MVRVGLRRSHRRSGDRARPCNSRALSAGLIVGTGARLEELHWGSRSEEAARCLERLRAKGNATSTGISPRCAPRAYVALLRNDDVRDAAELGGRGLSPASVRNTLAPVRALLATAFEDGRIRSNPAAGVRVAQATPEDAKEDEAKAKPLSSSYPHRPRRRGGRGDQARAAVAERAQRRSLGSVVLDEARAPASAQRVRATASGRCRGARGRAQGVRPRSRAARDELPRLRRRRLSARSALARAGACAAAARRGRRGAARARRAPVGGAVSRDTRQREHLA